MILNEEMIYNLTFPDYTVEKFEFSLKTLQLKIFIDGAFLDLPTNKQSLGRGFLYFYEWSNLSIKRFNSNSNAWINIDMEPLKDICDIKFSNSTISLYGFGAITNNWLELQIHHAKIYAEFTTN